MGTPQHERPGTDSTLVERLQRPEEPARVPPKDSTMSEGYADLFVSATDGLRLYARDYDPGRSSLLPVVCLPGLARTAADFHDLALALSRDAKRPRRVLAVDYRGRGRSEWDANWRNYDIAVELSDLLQVLTGAGAERAVFVGTSRGGLIIMALAAARPAVLRGAVLNDVGPVLDGKGLVRIRNSVGRLPKPRDFAEAGEILRQLSDARFPRFTDEQWQALARGTWMQGEGGLVLAYDPKLAKTLEAVDLETPVPELWHLFEGLKRIPVLALRGANSDILSAQTLEAMRRAHPDLEAIVVPDQGHVPVIDSELAREIKRFVQRLEAAP